MGSEWTQAKLSDLVIKITKGTTPTKMDGGFVNDGVNFIKAEAVTLDGIIDISKFAYVTEGIYLKYRRSQLEENDILFSMAGVVLGKTAIVKKRHLPANINQAVALIRSKSDLIDARYLHYYLQQKSVFHFVNNATSQSAQPNINLQEIGELKIRFPELKEQKAIAHILSTLDDKIELNRQMNSTLESMAHAIFKSWFVDFDPVIDNALAAGNPIPEPLKAKAEKRRRLGDQRKTLPQEIQQQFPCRFVFTEELGWIPEGWREKPFRHFTIEMKNKVGDQDVPQYSSTNTGLIPRADTFKKQLSKDNSKNKLIRYGDIIFGMSRQILNFGLMHDEVGSVSSAYKVFHVDNSVVWPEFVEMYIRFRENVYISMLGSSSREGQSLSTEHFFTTPMIIPKMTLQNIFFYDISFKDKIRQNAEQIESLSQLRDTLLPKLISGQLRLPDSLIDKFAEQRNSPDAEQIISEAI